MVQGVDVASPFHNTMPSSGSSVEKSYEDVEIGSANEVEFASHKDERPAVEGEIFSGINKKTILAFLVWMAPLKV